jgi:riboflavin kinase/FMN adenylyltransferase
MKVIDALDSPLHFQSPALMTIGNFDGVHCGHTALLKHLVQVAINEGAIPAVFTFINHPSEILRPSNPTPLLCTYAHKVKLIEQTGIDLLIAVPFTPTFAEQTAEQFLKRLNSSSNGSTRPYRSKS